MLKILAPILAFLNLSFVVLSLGLVLPGHSIFLSHEEKLHVEQCDRVQIFSLLDRFYRFESIAFMLCGVLCLLLLCTSLLLLVRLRRPAPNLSAQHVE